MNWLFGVDDKDIKLSGLRKCLESFAFGSRKTYRRGNWSIANCGYDLDWELYYRNTPFMGRVAGEHAKFYNSYMPEKLAIKIAGIVESIFECTVDLDETYG